MSALTREGFTTVRVVGPMLPPDLLGRVVAGDKDLAGLRPADYHLAAGETPREAANRAWAYLRGVWTAFRAAVDKLPADDPAVGLTREKWLLVLFRELGYGRVPATPTGGLLVDERSFGVSHLWGQTPIHLLGWNVPLDRRTKGVPGAADRAPHPMLQECLNRTDAYLWALLSNGRSLRILRDSTSLAGASYVEFDLEAMFDGEVFSDFALLYLTAHQSRVEVLTPDGPASDCWLERWRTASIESGTRARELLRDGVKDAIEALGCGFLAHPANTDLRERLDAPRSDEQHLDLADYHRSLLRLVYRLLFLFVAEDRGALLVSPGDDATPEQRHAAALTRERYATYFSTARLRRLALRRRGTRHGDLWAGLSLVIDALGRDGTDAPDGRGPGGLPELGLPGLGGLFDHGPADVVTGYALPNDALLAAIRHLSVVQPKGQAKRTVDYRNLGAEELGSIYESLLELVPRRGTPERPFLLENLAGNDRKTSGSYYTPSSLIDLLLDEALDPLLDEAEKAPDPESALLELTVCDPACGSGHFLVAAARRIAARLARVRTDELDPSPTDLQIAMHDVVSACIYGVDLNPMAAELARVSLWLEALEPGRPLSFLDAHIKVGNALLGTTPALLAAGIPDAAYKPIEGDDKKWAVALRRRNRAEIDERLSHQGDLFADAGLDVSNTALRRNLARIETAPIRSLADQHIARTRYAEYENSPERQRALRLADTWCAAFVQLKTEEGPGITDKVLTAVAEGREAAEARDAVAGLAERYRFFHWHLEFPGIFDSTGHGNAAGWSGGFSAMVGNPPWDTLSPDLKEFFAAYEPSIRFMSKDDQTKQVEQLLEDKALGEQWAAHRRDLFALVHFLKWSGRYRMFAPGNLGKGDFDAYRMFVETALTMASPDGVATQVTKSGLYNGANAAGIRAELFDRCQLQLVLGMVNKGQKWFEGVDATQRFAAYVARMGSSTHDFRVAFQVGSPGDLAAAVARAYRLTVGTVRQQSPQALAISETAGGLDAELTDHMYRQWPAFGDETAGPPTRRYQREIDMGTDRDLFNDGETGLPLYEGRMIDQYDHRAKAWISGRGRSAKWDELPFGSPHKAIRPQWWVPNQNVPGKVGDRIDKYRVAFCDVAAPRNERSVIAALVPPGTICGHSAPTFTYEDDYEWAYLPWLAVANSLAADYLLRKKITLHLSLGILDALPLPRFDLADGRLEGLARRALRLTCTSPEMTGYWNAMSQYGWCDPTAPDEVPAEAILDDTARAEARAEIDVIVARDIFGLDRAQVEHVLATFPTLERNETRRYGEFRTRRLVLDQFDVKLPDDNTAGR